MQRDLEGYSSFSLVWHGRSSRLFRLFFLGKRCVKIAGKRGGEEAA